MTTTNDTAIEANTEKQEDQQAPVVYQQYPHQTQIFYIEIIETYPANLGTADLKMIGMARDGKAYAIKRKQDSKTGFIPASEFFCYHLARRVGIATPHYEIIKLDDDELAFGSEWEGGVLDDATKKALILNKNVAINGGGTSAFFGKAYGFDLFVNNIDRHFGNFLFRDSYGGILGLIFDHSRAWKETGLEGSPTLTDILCNTQQLMQLLKKLNTIDFKYSVETIDAIASIKPIDIESILSQMPAEWLSEHDKKEVVEWWHSTAFKKRVIQLKKEIDSHVMA